MRLKVGAGRRAITPELGTELVGYPRRPPAAAVKDDLTITAIGFESGGERALLMSATVCHVSDGAAERVKAAIWRDLGVPAANVIITATHTHSGPSTSPSGEEAYLRSIFVPNAVEAAREAMSGMAEAKVGVGTTCSNVGINRRQLLRGGEVILGQNPWGAYDGEMTVIAFVGDGGRPIASLIHASAHCTASGIGDTVTRDWAGYMIDRLEAEAGGIALFVNGSFGDVAPRMANGASIGDLRHAAEVGGLAGIDAVRARKAARSFDSVDFAVARDEMRIAQTLTSREETIRELGLAKEDPPKVGYPARRIVVCEEILKAYEAGDTGCPDWVRPQTIFRIGPVALVPIPFEPFTEIALRLRAYSPFGYTLTLGLGNGDESYLPSKDQLARGGYEVEMFRWARSRRLPDDADTKIIEENLRIIESCPGFAP